jgi:hypothetical protein
MKKGLAMAKKPAEAELRAFEEASVAIDLANFNQELIDFPSLVAYWNAQLAVATKASMQAKVDKEREEARVWLAHKSLAELDKKKLTLDDLRAKVTDNKDIQVLGDLWIEAEAERIRIRGIVDTLGVKRDMLQSLGAKLRVEMMSDPVVREQMAGATAMGIERKE